MYVAAAFVTAAVLARFVPVAATILALLPACLLPALALRGTGYYDPAHVALWLAPVLGLIVGRDGLRDWRLPGVWAPAIGHYGLCIALSWMLIAFREIDWQWALLRAHQPPVTAQGVPAAVAIIWIIYVVSATLVAILWFDAMFATDRTLNVQKTALWTLIASAAIGTIVAIVQMTVDIAWLNSGLFAYVWRASGLMLDANAFGMSASLTLAIAMAIAIQARRRDVSLVVAVFVFAAWAGIWGSGSRTALLVGAVSTMAALVAALRTSRTRRMRLLVVSGVIVAALSMAAAVAMSRQQTVGPVARIKGWLAQPGPAKSARERVVELWNRDGYGTAAVAMIRDFPLAGVGTGTFNFIVLDYTFRIRYPVNLPSDNAQNWFRHQVAEVGVLGSLGWLVWLLLFMFGVFRARARILGPAIVPFAALGALCLISLVGLPTQNPAVLMIAATIAAWTWRLLRPDDVPSAPSRWAWALAWAGALIFTGVTAWHGMTELRVPWRAAETGWEYAYGWHALDGSASPPFRWTQGTRAVAVVRGRGLFLRLRVRAQHPDIAENPVDVRVDLFNRTLVREQLRSEAEVVRYVLVPPGENLPLTFHISRTFQAPGPDPRDLGIAVDDWTFVDRPPQGAVIVR